MNQQLKVYSNLIYYYKHRGWQPDDIVEMLARKYVEVDVEDVEELYKYWEGD